MGKIRLTKNELKKQKDALKRFNRYLPTLVLKKQQLQMEIRKVESQIRDKEGKLKGVTDNLMHWVDVFGEEVGMEDLVRVETLRTETGNIAGIDIPVFLGLDFEDREYDLFELPPWVDTAVDVLKEILGFEAELAVLREQIRVIEEELRITTQRVNLFEKVKIPEAKENIRVIQIYLGDQQTAAVVRGKIAKKKIVKVS